MELLDTEQQASVYANFNEIFSNEEEFIIANAREQVNDRIKFPTYNTYTDANGYIPVDSSIAEQSFRLPPVIDEFTKILVVGDNSNGYHIRRQGYKNAIKKLVGKIAIPKTLPEGLFYATSLVVYDLPDTIEAGNCFKSELGFDYASLTVRRVEPNDRLLNNYSKVVEAVVETGSRSASRFRNQNKYQNIIMMQEGLQKKKRYLHNFDVVYTFIAPTLVELTEKTAEFKKIMYRYGVKIDQPKFVQKRLYEQRRTSYDQNNYTFLSNDTTLDTFYPFSSMELIETGKRAVYLGKNLQTGSPIIYNRDNRKLNYHIAIVGASGSGKSMTTKVMVYRLWKQVKEESPVVVVIIDPSNTREYRNLATKLGIDYKTLEGGIGIDPLHYDAPIATGILSKLFKLEKDQEDILFRIIEQLKKNGKNIETLENAIIEMTEYPDKSKFLNAVHHGMEKYGYIFKGTFPEKSFAVSTYSYDDDALRATSALVMLRTKEYFDSLPNSTAKFLIVDEGWKLMEDPTTAGRIETFSREMRKSNVTMVFIVQDPKDLVGSKIGQTILNNCDTKIILQTDTIAELAPILSLSQKMQDIVKTNMGEKGEGLFMASNKVVHAQIIVEKEEMIAFTTQAT